MSRVKPRWPSSSHAALLRESQDALENTRRAVEFGLPHEMLLLDLYVPSESAQRIAAPLVEVRSTTLADGSRIALRSETTMYPDARLARIETRYVHRRGHDLLAEENEAVSVTWYTPDDITTLLLDAGYRDAIVGESPREGGDNQTFSVTALA